MDTRQLAAFCAVVERRSFSQAAERLGVTQPAVSLQVRALEKRLGTQLLDRSGRRVEPTEAGAAALPRRPAAARARGAAARGAGRGGRRRARGHASRSAPRPARAGSCSRSSSASSSARHPGAARRALRLRHADDRRARRRPRARARRRRRGPPPPRRRVRAVLPRRGDPRLPARAPLRRAGRVTLDELRAEPLIVMQEGAGVRQVIEDELRALGMRLRDLDVRLELGLQESVDERGARRATASRSSPARRSSPSSRPARSRRRASRASSPSARSCSSAPPAAPQTRAAEAFLEFARERLRVIVRWGLDELPGVLAELGDRAAAPGRERRAGRAPSACAARGALDARCRPHRVEVAARGADGVARPRRRLRDRHGQGRLGGRRACRSSRCRRPTPARSGRPFFGVRDARAADARRRRAARSTAGSSTTSS